MGFLEWVDATKLVVSLILIIFGAASGAIIWVHKKMRGVADTAVREAAAPHENTVHRLGKLEGEVIDLGQEVGMVRDEMKQLNTRVSSVERTMESVARKEDVEKVLREVAGLTGAFQQHAASTDRQIAGLTQAALGNRSKS